MRRLSLLVIVLLAFCAAPSGAAQRGVMIGDACGPGPYYFCYSPQTLTIGPGDSVTWTNNSITPLGHNITRCTPAACSGVGGGTGSDKWAGSGTVHQGQTYSHTFTGAGSYVYYCTIHGYAQMHGTITVTGTPVQPSPPRLSGLKLRRAAHTRRLILSFTLSTSAPVRITVGRAGRAYRTKSISAQAGRNSTSVGISGLAKGRYTVTVTAQGGQAVRASFSV